MSSKPVNTKRVSLNTTINDTVPADVQFDLQRGHVRTPSMITSPSDRRPPQKKNSL